jgi:hypothetical protein
MSTPSKVKSPSGLITKPVTFLRHRHILRRVRDGAQGRLVLEDHLRLFVELGALGLVGVILAFISFVEVLVAPLARFEPPTASQPSSTQEVVRVAVVAGPAQDDRAVAIPAPWSLARYSPHS